MTDQFQHVMVFIALTRPKPGAAALKGTDAVKSKIFWQMSKMTSWLAAFRIELCGVWI